MLDKEVRGFWKIVLKMQQKLRSQEVFLMTSPQNVSSSNGSLSQYLETASGKAQITNAGAIPLLQYRVVQFGPLKFLLSS